jgi:hypothetical protein
MYSYYIASLGGSEIMYFFCTFAMILFVYFIIQGIRAFFREVNK